MRRNQWLTLLFLLLAFLALLGMGALQARQRYLLRGFPAGLPEPVNHGLPTLGLNVYLEQYDDAELTANLEAIAASGVRWLKQPFYFDPTFDWAASDRLVTAVARANPESSLRLVPLLDGSPTDNFAPIPPGEFAAWAGEFAARYANFIQFYVIWDEPNLTSHWGNQPVNPIEYAALLSAAAAAIRAADADAVIIAAPLAPTVETGPQNLADALYLQRLYEAGAAPAFDVVAAKPYGFATGPDDRRVSLNVLNFSRAILLREVLERNNEGHKAVWAGNWGWTSLPAGWSGSPSIWGEATPQQQVEWTTAAFRRAQIEWPWMGVMFLENWEPNAPHNDPRWGFSLKEEIGYWKLDAAAQSPIANLQSPPHALPGFHPARPDDPAQVYVGGWRFSPQFGADISETGPDERPDEMTFTFWGTDVGLRVRRANFRARLYVTIDGRPANALPRDENGSMLILTAADPAEDYLAIEPIATNLAPGVHTVHITASRGWDQWALNGFSVGYRPPDNAYRWGMGLLAATAVLLLILTIRTARGADWAFLQARYAQLGQGGQVAATAVLGALVSLTGWLTWGAQAEGVYRRLSDVGQLALTAGTAVLFYASPSFIIYVLALGALFLLLFLRPAWGLALIAFSFPFYVLPKPMIGYLFSPVEVFTLVTFAAVVGKQLLEFSKGHRPFAIHNSQFTIHNFRLLPTDYAVFSFILVATLSLLFTQRLDVATNEWRVVIVEPALFYLLLRLIKPRAREMWVILDAFVLSGVVVAGYGLWQVVFDREALITAEGGLMRLRSVFGSPNNVGLYLGRILPLLAAAMLLGQAMPQRRRWAYVLAVLPIGLALLLSFSRGALFLGVPAGLLVVFWVWQRRNGRSPWAWVLATAVLVMGVLLIAPQIPALAGRFDLRSATGIFRLNLWRASLEMLREHPLTGVGLDNFLYAYRGRYILDAAWQEPNLSHPHNMALDFATRLGLLGLLTGGWLFWQLGRSLRRTLNHAPAAWQPVAIGFLGALAATLAHGLVDHSFFLVDLAFVFYLLLGTAVWLEDGGGVRK